MSPEDEELIRRRQKSRATIMAVLLVALAVLIFAITLTRIKASLS